jgi:hypothetical protein
MAIGVRLDKKREKELKDTTVITPHGAEITVTKSRAAVLLARPAIRFGDGTARTYTLPGTDNVVPDTTSKAVPPRKGDGRNAGE